MIRKHLYLSEPIVKELEAEAVKKDLSFSELVRRVLERHALKGKRG